MDVEIHDIATTSRFTFKVSGIAYASATELDLSGLGLTRYRFRPSVVMRAVEDAESQAQADDWLQSNQAIANGRFYCLPPVAADEWSEWQYFDNDLGLTLTNIWFNNDAAGTGQTAEVEAE